MRWYRRWSKGPRGRHGMGLGLAGILVGFCALLFDSARKKNLNKKTEPSKEKYKREMIERFRNKHKKPSIETGFKKLDQAEKIAKERDKHNKFS